MGLLTSVSRAPGVVVLCLNYVVNGLVSCMWCVGWCKGVVRTIPVVITQIKTDTFRISPVPFLLLLTAITITTIDPPKS